MDKKPKPAVISKKHVARLERERTQTRIVRWVAFAVILATVLLVGYGILDMNVLRLNKPVAVVNGEKISLRTFQTYVRLYRQNLIENYNQASIYTQMGLDMSSQMQQVASMLSNSSQLGEMVIGSLIDEALVRQEAKTLGISISDEELETHIRENYGYYENGTPTPGPTATKIVNPTLSAAQLAIVTITPTATRIPTRTPDPNATTTPVPGPTEAAPPEPTATPYTLEGFQTLYDEQLSNVSENLEMKEADFRTVFLSQMIREKVMDAITADLPSEQEMVWARHILVKDETIAKVIRQRLLDGEDFASVAAEASEDPGSKDQGGDLGWFGKGAMVAEFEQAVFSQKLFEIGEPVKSQFGYHIIQVLGKDTRPMTNSEYEDAKQKAFDEWLAKLREEAEITRYDDFWKAYIPEEPVFQPQALPR